MVEQVVIFTDGGARNNPGLAALGVYVPKDPKSGKPIEASGFLGKASNNVAEYKSLIYALFMAKQQGWKNLLIKMDSLLVVNQFKGVFQIKNIELMKLYEQVQYYLPYFDSVELEHIPREQNKEADRLVNRALDKAEAEGAKEEVAFI